MCILQLHNSHLRTHTYIQTTTSILNYVHIFQYNETNVMQFSFNLLRIKRLYMFRALLAHPQEELHKRHLVYCVRIMSVGCGTVAVKLQPCKSASRWFHYTNILWCAVSKTLSAYILLSTMVPLTCMFTWLHVLILLATRIKRKYLPYWL
jgi:hypothetical protein